jgi:hypothetical protein
LGKIGTRVALDSWFKSNLALLSSNKNLWYYSSSCITEGRSKGKHKIRQYCGEDVKFVEEEFK